MNQVFKIEKKEILPIKYKVGYYMIFVMVFFWAFIYANLYATDFIFVKCLVVALCMLSMDYGINMYSRKTNEFIFKKGTGIYKQIAKNSLVIIEYMKVPVHVGFFLTGICLLLAM